LEGPGGHCHARVEAAVARSDASAIRLTLDGDLSVPGPVSVEYGAELWPYDEAADQNPGGTIYDNRHTLGWPVDNAELRNTRMNLQRLRAPLAEGTGGRPSRRLPRRSSGPFRSPRRTREPARPASGTPC
jgi:hypothetical protein